MSTVYNKYYEVAGYFGKPYPQMVSFFEQYPLRNTVLDLGCGQGRDALFLGELGYKVVGVDTSSVGINQMNAIAKAENLDVQGIVGDLYTFPITDAYDVILLDSIVHFYKNDIEKESQLLTHLLKNLKEGGVFCHFMQKGAKREKILKDVFYRSGIEFDILKEGYAHYPEFDATFHMIVLLKKPKAF